jgi:hypothetical protein
MRSCKDMSWCPTSVARTYHCDEMWDRLRARAYGDGGLVVVVGVMPHRGAWESHAQGEAVQADSCAGGSARDVYMLNWRMAAAGEPCDAETVTHGSERDGGKRASDGTSPAVYSTSRRQSTHSTRTIGVMPDTGGRGAGLLRW